MNVLPSPFRAGEHITYEILEKLYRKTLKLLDAVTMHGAVERHADRSDRVAVPDAERGLIAARARGSKALAYTHMQIGIARLLGAARLLPAIGCLACGDVPIVPPSLASISIAGDSTFDLNVGGQTRLVVVARDVIGNLIVSPGNVTFASRNPSVASVDATGLVTAVAAGPQTYVVATLAAGHDVLADSVSVLVTMLLDRMP